MKNKKILYTCPMHPEIVQEFPGKCPKCGGMDLVLSDNLERPESFTQKYKPLIIIFLLLILATGSLTIRDASSSGFYLEKSMSYFMASFFLVFSGFKLLDLKGFQSGYSTYDLLAKKFPLYGFVYPFIEFGFGLGYLLETNNKTFHSIVFTVMVFSAIGVFTKLFKKEEFQCVCLGTFIKVPLTKVTLIEDLGMAFMALLMLFI